ncbi:unnamed protein product [Owenia fusiformis]|uniref:Superoxide dismutase [Cu-Zn] n=1 Tax=Owenia fusiformis TaxID=6347 RepID=A0A8J1TIZ5_OWEFU|nr:unnamed protein product [Owenia fusiformis]
MCSVNKYCNPGFTLANMKLLIFFAFVTAVRGQFECPVDIDGNPIDGGFAHETDCTRFYNCWEGEATEWTCEDGLWFDSWTQGCVHPIRSDCKAGDYNNARCRMTPNDPDAGQQIFGDVFFRQNQTGGNTDIYVELRGFDPNDAEVLHGMHVHTEGSIEGGCAATGGHFNPTSSNHGSPASEDRHVGDLGNIEEDTTGSVVMVLIDDKISLLPANPNYIIGRSIVVHATYDDYGLGNGTSLINGNAGARLACCVIMANDF